MNVTEFWTGHTVRDEPFRSVAESLAFRRSTDTESCPISRAYEPREFVRLCADAGLRAEFLGGYFTGVELDVWRRYAPDTRLAPEHRRFLAALEGSPPMYRQHYAGIGGVYRAVRA